MASAVRFDRYGGLEVLYIAEVEVPSPSNGEVLVEVRAAGTNPGEAAIREGLMDSTSPAKFPSGQGSDLAGVVSQVGDDVVRFGPGDEVLGWSFGRSSQADYVVVPAEQLILKPPSLSWAVAGALYAVGVTAYATVRAVGARSGDTVVVSSAAGGVGSVAVQLLRNRGANVIGIASVPNHEWLRSVGANPVAYGAGLADRIQAMAPSGVDALIDTFGNGYVDLAIQLGVVPDRIDTTIAFEAAKKFGAKTEASLEASTTEVLEEMADLVVSGAINVPIAATYRLDQVQEAYRELEKRHTHGKIVLIT